jgi:hypothetical protein
LADDEAEVAAEAVRRIVRLARSQIPKAGAYIVVVAVLVILLAFSRQVNLDSQV